jgi:hypothetical protein
VLCQVGLIVDAGDDEGAFGTDGVPGIIAILAVFTERVRHVGALKQRDQAWVKLDRLKCYRFTTALAVT